MKKRFLICLAALLVLGCVSLSVNYFFAEIPRDGHSGMVSFDSLFTADTEGHYINKYPLKIGAVQLGKGTQIGSFVTLNGLSLEALQGKKFKVSNHEGVLEIIQ
ncbi:hypothetical protein [Photobacterium galatheae]|uniref:Lipoprotein n=1 Tax=Photobacterium galatheae TaxID=1654360 RepID=A0A066RH81_9GAMM|nr:hypothetical protein [Photobacterium galatheae]KDM89795.1 hypothetical protein EA58_20295 [Photobacterium galatheae]MCM0151446.1 hypothetical protein [Photobacterium galatheae]